MLEIVFGIMTEEVSKWSPQKTTAGKKNQTVKSTTLMAQKLISDIDQVGKCLFM